MPTKISKKAVYSVGSALIIDTLADDLTSEFAYIMLLHTSFQVDMGTMRMWATELALLNSARHVSECRSATLIAATRKFLQRHLFCFCTHSK